MALKIGACLWAGVWVGLMAIGTQAQIVPDDTLGGERSQVRQETIRGTDSDRIEGGARRGGNLFHSFQQLDVEAGRGVYFANPEGVSNILSRVTGIDRSEIFGTLGVLGSANLFLINPNGILFGSSASLDIQGSFTASTATGVWFGDQGVFSATDTELSNLLEVNPSAFFLNQAVAQGGAINSTANLTAGQDLILSGLNLDLQGQLRAGRSLTLYGADSVQIRDSSLNPFIAASGKQLLVQGDRTVDIFALNHPNSGLLSGGDMVLRSGSQVGGDARYWSGGNFRIERSDGSLENLYSPYDPIIFASGDISLEGYVGASLHIFAGGSITIPGTILIRRPDADGTGLISNIILSDGTNLPIDSTTQATVDLRAGIDWQGLFPGNLAVGTTVPSNTFGSNATSADITIGNIAIDPSNGLVLITNQFEPNRALPGGDITIAGVGNPSNDIKNGIDARGFFGDGSSVFLDSRGAIVVAARANIDTSAGIFTNTGRGGDIRLLANDSIQLNQNSFIETSIADGILSSPRGNLRGGNIWLSSPNITFSLGASVNASRGGNIDIQSDRLTLQPLSSINSFVLGDEIGGNIQISATETFQNEGGNIGTFVTETATGQGGSITINTGELTTSGFIFRNPAISGGFLSGGDISTDTIGNGGAGNITIDARQIRVLDGAQIRTATGAARFTSGEGRGGNINIRASELVEVRGNVSETSFLSRISSDTESRGASGDVNITIDNGDLVVSDRGVIQSQVQVGGTGQGGDTIVTANNILLEQGGQITAGTFGEGNSGTLTARGSESIQVVGTSGTAPSGLLTSTNTSGRAGDLTVNTRRLSILSGGQVSSSTLGFGGEGGSLNVTATDSLEVAGNSSDNEFLSILSAASGSSIGLDNPFAVGNGGNITINTGQLTVRDGGNISTQALQASDPDIQRDFGEPGNAGSIVIRANDVTVQNRGVITTNTQGLGQAGALTIDATENIRLLGGDLRTRTTGAGNAGTLTLTAGNLTVNNGEATAATDSGGGRGGDISVTVRGDTEFVGRGGGLAASSFRSGDAGNLVLQTNRLFVREGASIITESIGRGRAGDLTITAPGGVEVNGGQFVTGSEQNAAIGTSLVGTAPFNPTQIYFSPSRISASVSSIVPNTSAANLTIDTDHLSLQNGGGVSTQTLGSSPGGRLSITAQQINVVGNSGNLRADVENQPSTLSATTSDTGNAGNIQLNVRRLQVSDRAEISAAASAAFNSNPVSRGAPGSILIQNADSVVLYANGTISTAIESGVTANNQPTQSGNINIQTHALSLNSSGIAASTSGQGNAGNIAIRNANTVRLDRNSTISSTVNPGAIGNGGTLNIQTNTLNLDRSNISASTSGQGSAGNIRIRDAETVALVGRSTISTAVAPTGIGRGGDITIQSDSLHLGNRSEITASAAGQGRAGDIRVNGANGVTLANRSNISATTQGNGRRAGDITINSDTLNLTSGGRLRTNTNNDRRAGNITLLDLENITINGRASGIFANTSPTSGGNGGRVEVTTDNLTLENRGTIAARSNGAGRAGRVTIAADNVTLSQAQISARSSQNQPAGNIRLNVDDNFSSIDSRIITSAQRSSGGNITLNAEQVNLNRSGISTSVETGGGNGGNISITSENSVILDNNSDIQTRVANGQGDGGNIRVGADAILAFADSDILTTAKAGRGGDITLGSAAFFGDNYQPDAPQSGDRVNVDASGEVDDGTITTPDTNFIQNSLADIPEAPLDTDRILANSCLNRTQQTGRFTRTGTDGLPQRPGNANQSDYSTGAVQSIPEAETRSDRPWQMGDAIVEPQGVYRLSEGRLVLSRECSSRSGEQENID
jgi:filamentous hemagglutinin family protein